MLLFNSSFAQLFGPEKILSMGKLGQPKDLYSVDLDGDNLIDVVAVGGGKIVWYKNLGDGIFDFQKTLVDHIRVSRACLADIDKDSDLDLAYISSMPDTTFGWSENNGNGAFINHFTYSYDTLQPREIFTADLDMDTQPDLIINYYNYQYKNIWFKNNSGVFTGQWALLEPDPDMHIIKMFKDMDGDGDADMILQSDSTSSWIENNGSAYFQDEHIVFEDSTIILGMEDIDGDSDHDIIYHSPSLHTLGWKENLGAGSFGTSFLITDSVSVSSICCDDFDNDDDMDVMSGDYGINGLRIYENTGGGFFNEAAEIYFAPGINIIRSGDFDGDGFADFTNTLHDDQRVVWCKNLSGLNFSEPENLTSKTQAPLKIFAADMDGDSDNDILSVSIGQKKVDWFQNIGDRMFSGPHLIADSLSRYFDGVLKAGDLDGDLDNDIFVALFNPCIIENLGEGEFGPIEILNSETWEFSDGQIVDLNGDDIDDIIAAHYFGIDSYLNDGSGSFTFDRIIHETGYHKYLHLNDITGDEDDDMVFSTYDPNYIKCYENSGAGNFGFKWEKYYQGSSDGLILIDMDEDNDNDLLANLGSTIAWYENDGDGNFGEMIVIENLGSGVCNSLHSDDLDNDLDNDLIYATDLNVYWLESKGGGEFGEANLISNNAGGVRIIQTSDLDDDGDKDLIYPSLSNDKVVWHENLLIGLGNKEIFKGTQALNIYPNPFTKSTQLMLNLDSDSKTSISINDIMGNQKTIITNQFLSAGKHQITWEAEEYVPGIYVVILTVNNAMYSQKVIIID